jgi:TonB family protein
MTMRIQLIGLGALLWLPALRAQSVFVAYEDGTQRAVRAVYHNRPFVEEGKKLVESGATRFALQKAAIYSSAIITVTHENATVHHLEMIRAGTGVSYSMRFEAMVTSDTNLENCFMVMELTYLEGKGIIYQDLPNLRAGETVPLGFLFDLEGRVGPGHYKLHFFADGLELLTSKMKPDYIAAQKRKIEEFRLRDQADRNVVAASTVAPVYPAELTGQKVSGSATVRCHVDPDGKLVDAQMVTATNPAFGAAALAAVRQWQFGAAIKNHRLVESTVDLPFDFSPLPEPGKWRRGRGVTLPASASGRWC